MKKVSSDSGMKFVARGCERLDHFLASCEELKSRSEAQKLVRSGAVRVDGKVVLRPSHTLSIGSTVFVLLPTPTPVTKGKRSKVALPILFEDDQCFVVSKPAGISVHPGAGTGPNEETMLDALAALFENRDLPFSRAEVLVHRLDRDTTGCLLVAKTPKAHQKFQEQFMNRTVKKQYLALVEGNPKHMKALIDAPIGRSALDRTKMSVVRSSNSRAAQTSYVVLEQAGGAALLSCDLHTGRTHQIRVHLKSIGHPILGDSSYATRESQKMSEKYGATRPCLHAASLTFQSMRKTVTVSAPLPRDFVQVLQECGITRHGL